MSAPTSIGQLIKQQYFLEKRAGLWSTTFGAGRNLLSRGAGLFSKAKTAVPRPPNPLGSAGFNAASFAKTAPTAAPMTFGGAVKGAMRGAGNLASGTAKLGFKSLMPLGLYGIPGINMASDFSNARVYAQGAATGVAETLRNIPFGLGEKALEWKLKNSEPASFWGGTGLLQRRVMSDALARLKGGFTANDIINPLDQALSDSVHSDWARAGLQTVAEQRKALAQHIAQQQQTANITR